MSMRSSRRNAALSVGLDPAIGVMHADLRARDSLACDLMEPIRPKADAFVLEFLRRKEFRKADFFETREGVCRLLPPIVNELAENSVQFCRAIGGVAEDVAQRLFRSSKQLSARALGSKIARAETTTTDELLPTPLTQSNREQRQRSSSCTAQAGAAKTEKIGPAMLLVWQGNRRKSSRLLQCLSCASSVTSHF